MNKDCPSRLNCISDKISSSIQMRVYLCTRNIVNQNLHVFYTIVDVLWNSTQTQKVSYALDLEQSFILGCSDISKPNSSLNFVHNVYMHRIRLNHLFFNINFGSHCRPKEGS